MSRDSRYLWSAKLIAICTLLSRVTGLARDITLDDLSNYNDRLSPLLYHRARHRNSIMVKLK